MPSQLTDTIMRRLPIYYRHLCEMESEGVTQISSKELGDRLNQTPSQIRQDFNCFGGFGRQGYGYKVSELKDRIGALLGLHREHHMIVLGAGSIGRAITCYPAFTSDAFHVLGLFDIDQQKIGKKVNGLPVHSMEDLPGFLDENPVEIAVLAVPRDAAQQCADLLVEKGVRAFWNFAPVDLRADPQQCTVVDVHLSDSLQLLSCKMEIDRLSEAL